jgi:hypothetical protein
MVRAIILFGALLLHACCDIQAKDDMAQKNDWKETCNFPRKQNFICPLITESYNLTVFFFQLA